MLISAAIHYFYFVQLITITHLRSAHCTIQSFQGLRSPPYILPSSTMMMFNAFFSFILRLSICSSQFGQLFNVICKNWTLSLFGMICFISVTSNSSLFLFFLFLNTIFTCWEECPLWDSQVCLFILWCISTHSNFYPSFTNQFLMNSIICPCIPMFSCSLNVLFLLILS